jgi:hypothetical protein
LKQEDTPNDDKYNERKSDEYSIACQTLHGFSPLIILPSMSELVPSENSPGG